MCIILCFSKVPINNYLKEFLSILQEQIIFGNVYDKFQITNFSGI